MFNISDCDKNDTFHSIIETLTKVQAAHFKQTPKKPVYIDFNWKHYS